MKRINLTSFGFVRDASSDFSDDGTRFFCYRVGKVRVSKALWNDRVYLSGRAQLDDKLNYDEYSKLAHYNDLDKYNGVSIARLTEADLQELHNSCEQYEIEYSQAVVEKMLTLPSKLEVENRLAEAAAVRVKEYTEIETELAKHNVVHLFTETPSTSWLVQMSEALRYLHSYANSYKIASYLDANGNLQMRCKDIMKTNWSDLQPNYWYKKCRDLLLDLK